MQEKSNTIVGDKEKSKYKNITLQEVEKAVYNMFSKHREKPKKRNITIYLVTPYGLISHEAILSGELSQEILNCPEVKHFLKQFNKALKENINKNEYI